MTRATATFGMAGEIRLAQSRATSGGAPWLASVFRSTPHTTRVEWRSDTVSLVTCQHDEETRQTAGADRCDLPRVGDDEGLVFGHPFEAGSGDWSSADASRSMLTAYRSGGQAAFESVNAGWVGFVWNPQRQDARFIRDGVGSHVLYVAREPGRIVFGTDLRIFAPAGISTPIDEDALAEFLRFLYVPPPRTIRRGIEAVHTGHVLRVHAGATSQQRYAAPRFVDNPVSAQPATRQEIAAQVPIFEERLLNAVSDCLPRSGRVALALSGGQDSATLAVALRKLCPDRLLAFTVGERDPRLSEAPHASIVCEALGIEHQVYVPTDDEIALGMREFVAVSDQPVGDLAALPYFLGMKRLPEDCSIVLDGSGNDDYFGVTGKALELRYKTRSAVQRFVPDALWPVVTGLMAKGPVGIQSLSRHWSRPIEESFVPWEGWPSSEISELIGRPISLAETRLYELMRRGDPEHWRVVMTDAIGGIWEAQAGFPKGMQFAHALGRGIRYPFIDARMMRWAHALPMTLKLDKVVMLAYMERNLPAEIVKKPKSGFIFDLNRIFLNPVHRWADELNARGALKIRPEWSAPVIDRLLSAHAGQSGDSRWQHRLYALCLLAAFVETQAP